MAMLYLIIIFAVVAIIFSIITYAISIIYNHNDSIKNRLKIKFDSFIKFYNVNPKAWYLADDYVSYYASSCSSYKLGYGVAKKDFDFCFSFIYYLRYKIWKKQNDKRKQDKKNAQEYLTALKYIEEDIKLFAEQNNNLIEDEIKRWQNGKANG